MHSPVYLAICVASLSSMFLFGTPELPGMVLGAALLIAVLGVPHGGLDHWTGRRLLSKQFASYWWLIFFPSYLLIGSLFAVGWYVFPVMTVIVFFLVSSWHFGREDQLASMMAVHRSNGFRAFDHVMAASVGGLIIWIPSLVRPEEMRTLLSLIVPGDSVTTSIKIVGFTQIVATCMVPIAAIAVLSRLIALPQDYHRWVPLATTVIAVCMPILISFSVYFCAWHSWQGLQRLRREEALTAVQFVRCVIPLSAVAILAMVAVGWWMQGASAELLAGGQSTATLQAGFIGLSAIAVPHLFLHELDSFVARTRNAAQVSP